MSRMHPPEWVFPSAEEEDTVLEALAQGPSPSPVIGNVTARPANEIAARTHNVPDACSGYFGDDSIDEDVVDPRIVFQQLAQRVGMQDARFESLSKEACGEEHMEGPVRHTNDPGGIEAEQEVDVEAVLSRLESETARLGLVVSSQRNCEPPAGSGPTSEDYPSRIARLRHLLDRARAGQQSRQVTPCTRDAARVATTRPHDAQSSAGNLHTVVFEGLGSSNLATIERVRTLEKLVGPEAILSTEQSAWEVLRSASNLTSALSRRNIAEIRETLDGLSELLKSDESLSQALSAARVASTLKQSRALAGVELSVMTQLGSMAGTLAEVRALSRALVDLQERTRRVEEQQRENTNLLLRLDQRLGVELKAVEENFEAMNDHIRTA